LVILIVRRGLVFSVQDLKYWLGGGNGAKSQPPQKGQGYTGLGTVGHWGIEANYLTGCLKVGEVGFFQVVQGGGNGEGEDLARLETSLRIYMEISAAQADVPEDSLTPERGVGIGPAGMESHREGHHDPAKPSSFQRGDHEPALT
jgi:hypothetical protein